MGGSGVKGAVVDLDTGLLVGERFRLDTPQPATPKAVTKAVAEVVDHFGWVGPVGVTYPGVVVDGVVKTAANVDKSWIGANVAELMSAALGGRKVTVLNDADAAGLAEACYGAGRDKRGLIVLLTFGTGIGSAIASSVISRSAARRPSTGLPHRSKNARSGITNAGPRRSPRS